MQVTATWEEILVAATAAGRGTAPLDERVRRHGEYVLSRLTVEADGRPVQGAVIATPAPDAVPPFTYTLLYDRSDPLSRLRERVRERADLASGDARGSPDPLTLTLSPTADRGGDSSAHSLTLHNALLRELGLTLGGPWEVSYVVTVSDPSGHTAADAVPRLLTAATPLTLDLDATLAPPASRARLAWAYLRQGVLHILRGYDHLLFVAALVLAAVTLRDLIKVVVAFTLAHATTLTLCALGWISIPRSDRRAADRRQHRGGGAAKLAGSLVQPARAAAGDRVRVRPATWLRLRQRRAAGHARPAGGGPGPGGRRVQPGRRARPPGNRDSHVHAAQSPARADLHRSR